MRLNPLVERLKRKIRSLLNRPPEDPDHPYALVGAPVAPRPPALRARAAAKPEA
ncbi:MAG TPA: hypothetical protein VMT15_21725 [Bryobacteraceae bacterium]|nr:hypothetical protein [Bryobacteraceae bacterium]